MKKNPLDWSWKEPTDEEFKKKMKTLTFYRIYHVVDTGDDIVDYKFWAKSDKEALAVLRKWNLENKDSTFEYFYSTSGYHMDQEGNRFDSSKDLMKNYEKNAGLALVARKAWWRTFGKIPDLWFRAKEALRRAFTGHSLSESWDLGYHVLEDLKHNLPLMRENANSYPDGLDMDRWNAILDELLLHVELYLFYDGFGIVDEKDPKEVEFKEKWEWSIPRKKGTKGEIDYPKLHRLQEREWNGIMRILRKWGRALWD